MLARGAGEDAAAQRARQGKAAAGVLAEFQEGVTTGGRALVRRHAQHVQQRERSDGALRRVGLGLVLAPIALGVLQG